MKSRCWAPAWIAAVIILQGASHGARADYVGLTGSVTGTDGANLLDGSFISKTQSRPATLYLASNTQNSYVDFYSEFDAIDSQGQSRHFYNDFALDDFKYDVFSFAQSGQSASIDISSRSGTYTADVYHIVDGQTTHSKRSASITPLSFHVDLDRSKLMRGNGLLTYQLSSPVTIDLTYKTSSATSTFEITATQLQISSDTIMAVPLPASAPMAGVALVTLGAASYAAKRRRAASA